MQYCPRVPSLSDVGRAIAAVRTALFSQMGQHRRLHPHGYYSRRVATQKASVQAFQGDEASFGSADAALANTRHSEEASCIASVAGDLFFAQARVSDDFIFMLAEEREARLRVK